MGAIWAFAVPMLVIILVCIKVSIDGADIDA